MENANASLREKKTRRSIHREAEYNRLKKKTEGHEFVDRLEREFEFSPRVSRGVLEVVEEMFFSRRDGFPENREIGSGQIEYTCVSSEEGAGKTMEEMKKVRVKLTRELTNDRDIQVRDGDSGMRKVQLLRMTEEAYDQSGLLTQEDLGRIMGVSSRTIRRSTSACQELFPSHQYSFSLWFCF